MTVIYPIKCVDAKDGSIVVVDGRSGRTLSPEGFWMSGIKETIPPKPKGRYRTYGLYLEFAKWALAFTYWDCWRKRHGWIEVVTRHDYASPYRLYRRWEFSLFFLTVYLRWNNNANNYNVSFFREWVEGKYGHYR